MSSPQPSAGGTQPSRTPLQVQWSVIHALFVRALSAQFGQMRGGLIWAFVEPLMQVLFFTLLFMMRGRHELNNIPIPMLVITGLAPFILFRQVSVGAYRAIAKSSALFNYRLVKPIDPVLAEALRYTVFFLFTLISMVVTCRLAGLHVEQVSPLPLILNLCFLVMMSTGLGLIFSVVLNYLPEARKFTQFMVRPLFFVSGIFFTADSIPTDYRDLLLYNPLLHVTEITRSCFYYTYPGHGELSYVAVWALCMLTAGLFLFRLNRRLFDDE